MCFQAFCDRSIDSTCGQALVTQETGIQIPILWQIVFSNVDLVLQWLASPYSAQASRFKKTGQVRWKKNLYKVRYNLVYFAPNQAERLFMWWLPFSSPPTTPPPPPPPGAACPHSHSFIVRLTASNHLSRHWHGYV